VFLERFDVFVHTYIQALLQMIMNWRIFGSKLRAAGFRFRRVQIRLLWL